MSKLPPVTDEIKQAIHFETLLAQAMAVVVEHAGERWTDRAEHDPGVTLLQALCYNVADLAYRHILPLNDLLTGEAATGVFPVGFGPEDALTCSPVTLEDYRAGLLDLSEGNAHAIVFRNVWMRRIEAADADAYVYYYDHVLRSFSFGPTADSQKMVLAGDYALIAERWLAYGASDYSEGHLQRFLTPNRNLGERTQIKRVKTIEDRHLKIELEVTDDIENIYSLVIAMYRAALDYVRPRAYWDEALADSADQWEGPRLQHGRAVLPPERVDDETIQLTPLADVLRRLPGVRVLTEFSSVNQTAPWVIDFPKERSFRLWGNAPLGIIASGQYVNFYKRGKRLPIDLDELTAQFERDGGAQLFRPIMEIPPQARGRPRTAPYHPTALRLPPCYGLQTPEPDAQQQQLHQFLLPFEQELANRCAQLASLPDLLSFDRSLDALGEDGQVWGAAWPYRDDDPRQEPARTLHAEYRPALEQINDAGALDYEKELDLIDHLLGYFGAARAPRALLRGYTPAEFLQVQRGYLRQIAELGYGRARIQVDRVSAVQRRIAARLGWEPELFGEEPPLDELPFYVIERRALLPTRPDASHDTPQAAVGLEVAGAGEQRVLWLQIGANIGTLSAGMVIDFAIAVADNADNVIGPLIIHEVVKEEDEDGKDNGKVSFTIADNRRLHTEIDKLMAAQDKGRLTWCNAAIWLQDIEHTLTGLASVPGVPSRRLVTLQLFPSDVQINDGVLFKRSLTAMPAGSTASEELGAQVKSIDPLAGTLVISANSATIAELDKGNLASWRMMLMRRADDNTDRFSFMVSVVLPRSVAQDESGGDPQVTADWIAQIVREEMPAHVVPVLHWLDQSQYGDFANTYSRWQNGGQPLGDLSYRLLQLLCIGELRAGVPGINARRVASAAQQEEGTDENGNYDPAYVAEHELLFIPIDTNGTDK